VIQNLEGFHAAILSAVISRLLDYLYDLCVRKWVIFIMIIALKTNRTFHL